jgi:hypothetical protein
MMRVGENRGDIVIGTLLRAIDRIATPRLALVLLVVEALLLGAVNTLDFPLSVPYMRRATGHNYLDMCAFCSAAQIQQNLEGFGDIGRRLQLLLMPTIDIAIPVTSGVFGAVALTVLARRFAARWMRWLPLVPLAAMALDFAENGAIIGLVVTYPRSPMLLATLSGLLSGLKFCAYGSSVATLVALLLADLAARRSALGR